ncbi:hypothetical protein J4G02_22135 [Candidatus Poribacteria bacterium]|nr:hypothetical protein [Candidatus Poribacteria bacterium]
MPDYQPLNLSSLCNVGAEILGENATPAIGAQTFHGLPFQISENGDCFLGFGDELNTEPATIPLNAGPKRIIVVHRLLESKIFEGDPVGRLVANYIFHYANGETVTAPIRERFEIAVVPPGWGQLPFLAWPDQQEIGALRATGRPKPRRRDRRTTICGSGKIRTRRRRWNPCKLSQRDRRLSSLPLRWGTSMKILSLEKRSAMS